MLSRGYITSCATTHGCEGGLSSDTYKYIRKRGGVTGGLLGCSPYFGHGEGTDHFDSSDPAPPCPTQCGASYTARPLGADIFKFSDMSYQELWPIGDRMPLVKQRIMQNGPIPHGIYANNAFMAYSGGIFQGECGTNPNHE